MKTNSINVKYINILFAIYMVSLIACSVFFYYRISILENAFSLVGHTIDVKLKLEQTLSNLRDAETEQRGYLLTNDSFFLEHYNDSRSKTFEKLEAVKELTKDNNAQRINTDSLFQLITRRFEALENVMNNSGFNMLSAIEKKGYLMNGKTIMDGVRDRVERMRNIENNLLQERQTKKEEAIEMTPVYVLGILVFSLIVLVACYIAMQRYRLRQTYFAVS